jgi:hypothetical protein
MTNFEKIQSMTIDEMAFEILCDLTDFCDYCIYRDTEICGVGYNCEKGITQWLEREA